MVLVGAGSHRTKNEDQDAKQEQHSEKQKSLSAHCHCVSSSEFVSLARLSVAPARGFAHYGVYFVLHNTPYDTVRHHVARVVTARKNPVVVWQK